MSCTVPEALRYACLEALEYLQSHYDVDDDQDGFGVHANREMQLGMQLQAAMVNAGIPEAEDQAS